MIPVALEEELAFFERNKAEWLQHYRDKFALIKGQRLLGTFTTFQEAFEAGIRELGNQAFLIEKVTEQDEEVQLPVLTLGLINVPRS